MKEIKDKIENFRKWMPHYKNTTGVREIRENEEFESELFDLLRMVGKKTHDKACKAQAEDTASKIHPGDSFRISYFSYPNQNMVKFDDDYWQTLLNEIK